MFHKDQILQFLKASPESFWVVDMREKEAFEKGHIKGAIHAPWGEPFKRVLEALPEETMMIPYCEQGNISWGAASLAQALGLKAMSIYDGAKTLDPEDYTKEQGSPDLTTIRELPEAVQEILKEDFIMEAEDVKEAMEKDTIYLVDVRDEAEERVPGSISLKELEVMDEPKKPLVFMCYSGQSSTTPMMNYKLKGHKAYSLEGGFGTDSNAPRGWKHKGFPVEKC